MMCVAVCGCVFEPTKNKVAAKRLVPKTVQDESLKTRAKQPEMK